MNLVTVCFYLVFAAFFMAVGVCIGVVLATVLN